tara:strand:+ start:167 stop:379 length:213 start_codon:yes stop_codon:yes gene_type:complete
MSEVDKVKYIKMQQKKWRLAIVGEINQGGLLVSENDFFRPSLSAQPISALLRVAPNYIDLIKLLPNLGPF